MKRRRKKAATAAKPEQGAGAPAQADSNAPPDGADGPGNAQAGQEEPTQYIFTFELVHQYPNIRSFIIKQQLKRSFGDTLSDLIGGSKKGVYKF